MNFGGFPVNASDSESLEDSDALSGPFPDSDDYGGYWGGHWAGMGWTDSDLGSSDDLGFGSSSEGGDWSEEEGPAALEYNHEVPLNLADEQQGPIVRYSRARTESGVVGDVNFLEHATASYPVPSGQRHHQSADTLCFLPRPSEDAAAAAAAAPGCEEVVIGGPLQPGSNHWQLGVYQVSDTLVVRLATIPTAFPFYSMSASPCGTFLAASGDNGHISIYTVVRGRYDASVAAAAAMPAGAGASGDPGATAAASAAAAAGGTAPHSLRLQLQHQERALGTADGFRAAAGWQLEHVATLVVGEGEDDDDMVNCVRWGSFGGKTRLLAVCQDGRLYLLNVPQLSSSSGSNGSTSAPPVRTSSSSSSGRGVPPGLVQAARSLAVTDLPTWQSPYDRAVALLAQAGEVCLPTQQLGKAVDCLADVYWNQDLVTATWGGSTTEFGIVTPVTGDQVHVMEGLTPDMVAALIEVYDQLLEGVASKVVGSTSRQEVEQLMPYLLLGVLRGRPRLQDIRRAEGRDPMPLTWTYLQLLARTAAYRPWCAVHQPQEQQAATQQEAARTSAARQLARLGKSSSKAAVCCNVAKLVLVDLMCSKDAAEPGASIDFPGKERSGASTKALMRYLPLLTAFDFSAPLEQVHTARVVVARYGPQQDAAGAPLRGEEVREGVSLQTCALAGFWEGVGLNTAQPSPDGNWVAVSADGIVLWVVPSGPDYTTRMPLLLDPNIDLPIDYEVEIADGELGFQYCAWNSSSSLLAASSDALKFVGVWSIPDGQLLFSFTANSGEPLPLSFLPAWPGKPNPQQQASSYTSRPSSRPGGVEQGCAGGAGAAARAGRSSSNGAAATGACLQLGQARGTAASSSSPQQQQQQQQELSGCGSTPGDHQQQQQVRRRYQRVCPKGQVQAQMLFPEDTYLEELLQQVRLMEQQQQAAAAAAGAEAGAEAGAAEPSAAPLVAAATPAAAAAAAAAVPAPDATEHNAPDPEGTASAKQRSGKAGQAAGQAQVAPPPQAGVVPGKRQRRPSARVVEAAADAAAAAAARHAGSHHAKPGGVKGRHEGLVVGPLPADMEQPAELLVWGTQRCAVNIAEMRCLSSCQPRPYLAPYYCIRQTLDWPPKRSPTGRELHGLLVTPAGRLLVTTKHPSDAEAQLTVARLLSGFSPTSFAAYPALFQKASRQLLALAHTPAAAVAAQAAQPAAARCGADNAAAQEAVAAAAATEAAGSRKQGGKKVGRGRRRGGQAGEVAGGGGGVGKRTKVAGQGPGRSRLQGLPAAVLDVILAKAVYPLGCWAQGARVSPLK